jgi:hypothetical protein
MSKHLPTFFILMITLFTQLKGQENKKNPNHIGIQVLTLKYVSENYIPIGYQLRLPLGISYKKDLQHLTTRYSINYCRTKTEYKPRGIDDYGGFNYYTVWSVSSGIEKNLYYGKLSIFFGLDLFTNLSIYKIDYGGGPIGQGLHESYYHLWVGLSPLAGFRYNIVPRVTLSIETNYNFAFRVINTDFEQYPGVEGFQHYINPINALTVYYNF